MDPRQEASWELQRARLIEWATSGTWVRFLANKTIIQTPFDRAMMGQYLSTIRR